MAKTRKQTLLSLPKSITINSFEKLIGVAEKIFSLENKFIPWHALDLSKIRKVNILGLLFIYKIIEFSVEKNCFSKPRLISNDFIANTWEEYGFLPLIKNYIDDKKPTPEKHLKKLKIQMNDKCIIAPQALIRRDKYTKNILKERFLPRISKYYSGEHDTINTVFTCFSEVLLNFWEHAVDDTKSVIIADGNKSKIEIACADTGNGIISTLSSNPKYKHLKNTELIEKAICKNVTSKENTNHMGYGLWLINQLVSEMKGKFLIISEGCYLFNNDGKISAKTCGYWKGTIVYIYLPLHRVKTICDIKNFDKSLESIKIDFL